MDILLWPWGLQGLKTSVPRFGSKHFSVMSHLLSPEHLLIRQPWWAERCPNRQRLYNQNGEEQEPGRFGILLSKCACQQSPCVFHRDLNFPLNLDHFLTLSRRWRRQQQQQQQQQPQQGQRQLISMDHKGQKDIIWWQTDPEHILVTSLSGLSRASCWSLPVMITFKRDACIVIAQ